MAVTGYRVVARVAVVALIIGVAFVLLRTGLADFLRLEPCAYLDAIEASGRRPDPAKLGAARDRLEWARTIDPANPVIQEYLGVVYYHRAVIVAADMPLRIGYLEVARDYYAVALTLRPHSGHLWAGMLAIQGGLLQSRGIGTAGADAGDLRGLAAALRHASRLAPWEVPVLNTVVTTGQQHYRALAAAERGLVDAAIDRARKLGLTVKSGG